MKSFSIEKSKPYLIWLALTVALKAMSPPFLNLKGSHFALFTGVLLLYAPCIYYWLRGEKMGFLKVRKPLISLFWLLCLFTLSSLAYGLSIKITGGKFYREKLTLLFKLPSLKFWASSLIVTAFPEEFFFRGFLFDMVGKNNLEKIVITSILFTITHLVVGFSPLRLLTFFPGAVLAYMRSRTGEIYAPAILHNLFNLLHWASST